MNASDDAPLTPLPHLPPRRADSHKGDFGTALLIGGSRGMAGSIALAGMAALRSGAGLVRMAVPDVCLETVASFEPSYMTVGLPCDAHGRIAAGSRAAIEPLLATATAIACGPGLSRSDDLTEFVGWLYTSAAQPAVFDADALNALATHADLLARPGGPRVLTPHPGEFRRLLAGSNQDSVKAGNDRPVREELEDRAVELAAHTGTIIVLKGHHTLVTDGRQRTHNTTGNPGMATGGTGDVLTGVITALLCQGLSCFDAARLGTRIHGLAGDRAAEELGQVSLIASDLVRHLSAAFRGA